VHGPHAAIFSPLQGLFLFALRLSRRQPDRRSKGELRHIKVPLLPRCRNNFACLVWAVPTYYRPFFNYNWKTIKAAIAPVAARRVFERCDATR
jgi:hypothetical protein